jgi:hypothetical protein
MIAILTITMIKKIQIKKEESRIQSRKHEIINMLNTKVKTIFYKNARRQAIQSMLQSWDDFQIKILNTFNNEIYKKEPLDINLIYTYTIQMINLAIYLTYSRKSYPQEDQSVNDLTMQYYQIMNNDYQDIQLVSIKNEIKNEFQKEDFNPENARQMIIAYKVTKLNFETQNENFFKVGLSEITATKLINNLATANETDPTVLNNLANQTIKEINVQEFRDFTVTSNQEAYEKLLSWATASLKSKQETKHQKKSTLEIAITATSKL